MTLTYISNYSNVTLTCSPYGIGNSAVTQCIGQISVIPYNQDLIIVLLTVITVCSVLSIVFKLWEKIG